MNTTRSHITLTSCSEYHQEVVAKALEEACEPFGGITSIVQPGETVLVKPNLLSPRDPATCVTTHPSIVAGIIRMIRQAGAAQIWVGDSCAGNHSEESLWQKTGMEEAVSQAGGVLKSFRQDVEHRSCGEQQVPMPSWLQYVDRFISVPKLKTHSLTGITCALKNSYGLVCGETKSFQHANHLSPRSMSDFLLDVYNLVPPDFIIVDAVSVMEGNGPANGAPKHLGLIAAGTDGAGMDVVCSRAFNLNPKNVPMLKAAQERRFGCCREEEIKTSGEGEQLLDQASLKASFASVLDRLPESFYVLTARILAIRPRIEQMACRRCGICAGICSQGAITYDETRQRYKVHTDRCILCFCCCESCPYGAIRATSILNIAGKVRRLLGRR